MLQSGDTAFVLISAALVLLMIPGLALFYGGMVRKKNVLGTIMQSFILISLVTFEWIYLGYSMSFGPDLGGWIGSLAWAGLAGVGTAPNADYAPTVPHIAFAMYQCMFAAITPALITGAVAERMRFGPFLIFSLAWTILIYNPVCHWVWGNGGWLKAMGVLDFAGGIVVHLTCGAAALAAVMLTGPRKDHGKHQIVPHNLPMTLLGTGLLWFGWFGFNAGSALAADGVAAGAFAATHIGGMAGMAMWCGVEWWHRGKPTTLGAASGAVAGLATITPGAGFVSPASAVTIGLLAGLICYGAVLLKARLRFDDSLDVVGIHGVGGVLGSILVGVFASKVINPAGADGLMAGNPGQLGIQLLAIAVVGVFAFAGSWLLLAAVKAAMGLRMTPQAETIGLDLSEHTEAAYGE
ncbi:ammonium transporter [Desulfovibrio aerotolerans]|uniref:Ammonium transporter n=1 Tax=Solidesulfovibrio aerotolerans TaxID=295255 RepID=A0A7C9N059_9BACT|nr:ammonium transporter [Solidesulfovibrio aerotolerans]MYL82917.1 ammonium transporter [Solidesulfovibrio aerotolerans]